MNITFLIGNGFDIGIGLKTRYEEFYDVYCKNKSEDENNIWGFKTILAQWKDSGEKNIVDWADFEKAFGEHSQDFTVGSKALYIERFEHFVSEFNAYLEEEEKKADCSNSKLIADTMNKAIQTYFHIRNEDKNEIESFYKNFSSERIYNFVSFNYTKVLDNCVKIFEDSIRNVQNRKIGEVLHVHGYVEENMIMGVNDVTQIVNPELAKDPDVISEIVKPQQNIEARTMYDSRVTSVIEKSDAICVYGMSLGETDRKWWQCIARWLAKNEKRILVILNYESKYDKRFPFVQRRFVNGMVQRFLEYSEETDELKRNIARRIYVGINHNVFSMQLCQRDDYGNKIVIKV